MVRFVIGVTIGFGGSLMLSAALRHIEADWRLPTVLAAVALAYGAHMIGSSTTKATQPERDGRGA